MYRITLQLSLEGKLGSLSSPSSETSQDFSDGNQQPNIEEEQVIELENSAHANGMAGGGSIVDQGISGNAQGFNDGDKPVNNVSNTADSDNSNEE